MFGAPPYYHPPVPLLSRSSFSPWSVAVLGLFMLVGLLWLPVVVIQIMMNREARRAASIENLGTRFHRRFTLWFVLGVPAFIVVIVIFFFMVAKPLSVSI